MSGRWIELVSVDGPRDSVGRDRLGIVIRQASVVDSTRTTAEIEKFVYSDPADDLTESYVYDAASNLIKVLDREDRILRYDRDALNRVWRERWKEGGSTVNTLTFNFDDLGRLDSDDFYDYSYDYLDRGTSIATNNATIFPQSVVLANQFDAAGNRTQLSAEIVGTDDFVNDYTYDYLDRMTLVTQHDTATGNPVADKRVKFEYNDNSQFTYIKRWASLDTSEYVGRTKFIAYDAAGRLTDYKHDGGGIATLDYDVFLGSVFLGSGRQCFWGQAVNSE